MEFSALVAFLEEYIRISSQPDYERTKEFVTEILKHHCNVIEINA